MTPLSSRPADGLLAIGAHVLLGLLAVACAGALAAVPGIAAGTASLHPEYAALREPLGALATAAVVLVLVMLASIGALVERFRRGTVLAPGSLRWIDGLTGALLALLALDVVAYIAVSVAQAGSPFIALMQFAGAAVVLALVLLSRVLRGAVAEAIGMRAALVRCAAGAG